MLLEDRGLKTAKLFSIGLATLLLNFSAPFQNGAFAKETSKQSAKSSPNQKATSKAPAKAPTKARSQGSSKAVAPIRNAAIDKKNAVASLAPLFPNPSVPSLLLATDFIGRDREVSTEMNYSAAAAGTRQSQIKQTEFDFRLQKPASGESLQLGSNLIRLYEEQASYLENLRGLGLKDKNYPDLNHFIKTARSNQVAALNLLLKQFPKSEVASHWKAMQLSSRMRIGDPSAQAEAVKFAKGNSTPDGLRVLLSGIAINAAAGIEKSNFGSVQSALEMDLDDASKSALLLYNAEFIARKNPRQALPAFEEATRQGGAIRQANGQLGPIGIRAAARWVELNLNAKPDSTEPEVIALLQSLGQTELARYYTEQVALHNVSRQPQRAMTNYHDILQIGDGNAQLTAKIELRVLDIAIGSKDSVSIEDQWKRISDQPGLMKAPGLDTRVLASQNLLWTKILQATNGENVDRFVRLHDLFAANIQAYSQSEDWELKTVDALWRVKNAASTATRGDKLANKAKTPAIKVQALRFAARAREKLLNIGAEPTFQATSQAVGGGSEESSLLAAYIGTLDRLAPLVSGVESEQSYFQSSHLTYLSGNVDAGRKRFEFTLTKFPKSTYNPKAVGFLLTSADSKNDFAYIESIARLSEKLNVTPALAKYKNLRAVIERAVFEQAVALSAAQKFEASSQKYLAFQKEFPKSAKADIALDAAAKNYFSARKVDLAVKALEILLAQYPSSKFAKESRWTAAEQSKGIGQMLRAANHYETFARTYKKEAIERSAWYRGAEMHKALGRYASSVTDFENHLAVVTSQAEKAKVAKDIADMQFRYGKSVEALAAYDRLIKLTKVTDDEIWGRAQMIELYLRLGQEGNARAMISRVLDLKPSSQDGFKTLARAKFSLAKMETVDLRNFDPMSDQKLKESVEQGIKRYDRVKSLYLAACEVPGLEICSVGYYETAKMGEFVAGKLLEVEMPPTLDPKEVAPIKSIVSSGAQRLVEESRSFAEQAEAALATGAPDADTAERIRIYANQQRGRDSGGIQPATP